MYKYSNSSMLLFNWAYIYVSFFRFNILININFIRMIVDTVLLVSIYAGLHYINSKIPNFMFFPKGAVLFMPPEDNPQNKPNKKKKDKTQNQVQVIKIQYQNVKQYPFANEFSRVQITSAGLILFLAIRYIISFFTPNQTLISFYILILLLIYTIKLGIDTFFLTNYSKKYCFGIAFGINFIFYVFYLLAGSSQGVFDNRLNLAVLDYRKHLSIIFNRDVGFITDKSILILTWFFNFFIIIAMIPNIIKFGNWYAKTMKQIYFQQQNQQKMAKARRADIEEIDEKQKQNTLKEESKTLLYSLNVYLGFMLALQFFSHRYICNFLDEDIVFLVRIVILFICIYIICSTMSRAIEFNGSFAYKYVLQFFQTDDTEKRSALRKKIANYIYYLWYHYFQNITRIAIPMIIFMLIIYWKYLGYQRDIISGSLAERSLNEDVQCHINTNTLQILQNLYKCDLKAQQSQLQQKYFLSGIIRTIPQTLDSKVIQDNIQKYGILTKELMTQFWEQLFWYSSLSMYLMTVLYILFLRKTVYDL